MLNEEMLNELADEEELIAAPRPDDKSLRLR